MNKIRKGDKVILNTGKDKGKQGIVLNILKNNRVVVEGLNMVKKNIQNQILLREIKVVW